MLAMSATKLHAPLAVGPRARNVIAAKPRSRTLLKRLAKMGMLLFLIKREVWLAVSSFQMRRHPHGTKRSSGMHAIVARRNMLVLLMARPRLPVCGWDVVVSL
jgi:hypothetical protein